MKFSFLVKIHGKVDCIFTFTDWSVAADTIAKLCALPQVYSVEYYDK